ncbi:3-hydroxyacyl-CoA dehydrogenase family protein [Halovenus sp. WSH3]|uniref:3-hydroxyacyl-CoA dehydrogenase family protein n=1 Tax=Halovenus carboxidivorans TaxID=2692199 RepID=A0A6B0T4S9_9EURY|nr:3-hydroxyacyl-CoA dehydrogenase family protein [Halovenus carboxidivorans]MXR51186.1 3-hydroxyacyl-CoA dehydrogenase family protein [Halovenus carboxidivorans]
MNVAVLGSGRAGRDIAARCARAGHAVSLQADDATDRVDDIEGLLIDAVDAGELSEDRRAEALSELQATTDLGGAVSDADIVIETATADTEQLQELFADVESAVDRDTLIVTSQPAVPVTAAAAGLRQPDRAFGMHFVDAPGAEVVELLVPEQTGAEPTERAESFIAELGATPVRIRDTPGMASRRLRLAAEVEAMRAIDDGITDVESVDTILEEGYDHSDGPLVQADRAGLDRRLEELAELAEALGPRFEPPEILESLVEAGKTGANVGEGFYRWERGEPVEPAVGVRPGDGGDSEESPRR